MPEFEMLLKEANSLPVAERIQLLDAIWDTLPEDALPPLSDEWISEIERRSAEFDAGGASTVPWDQVKSEALQRLSAKSSDVPS